MLGRLGLADGSGEPEQATEVRVAWSGHGLYVRFACADRDVWGSYRRRDDPVYQEEAVEVFLAAGEEDPLRYCEIELSPHGTLFEALISNPTGRRADLVADTAWDLPGLRWQVGRSGKAQDWWAALVLPWSGLEVFARQAGPGAAPAAAPELWRANFYRIERPRDAAAEFSAWAPTWRRPADFHRPECFGLLELG